MESMTKNLKVEVRCVLKTGGCYNSTYVKRLKESVEINTTIPITFVCLTDDGSIDFCDTVRLKYDWPGWWSKIELFRADLKQVPCVFFDLDTIIRGNINDLIELALNHDFLALRGFNQRFAPNNGINFASGIMLGSFFLHTYVLDKFKEDPDKFMTSPELQWMHGDQGFIYKTMGITNLDRIQHYLADNYIVGKRIIKRLHGIPKETRVIAWSGTPRLHSRKCPINYLWEGVSDV